MATRRRQSCVWPNGAVDALVWALTALIFDGGGEPRVRGI